MHELKYHKFDKTDGVARITFARPKHNVFNIEMIEEFNGLLEDLAHDGALNCVAIFGEGRSWSAGVEVADHKPECVDQMISVFNQSFACIEAIEVPTIAAVHGACLGGGMEYAIACDMIIASEAASFGQPEVKLAFFPPYAAIRLPQLVGPAKTIEICSTGRIYSASEAQTLGFVAHVVPADNFQDQVEKTIAGLASSSPLILRLNKQAVTRHLGLPPAQALSDVSDLFLNTLMKTEDTLEGIASFTEKRKPQWKNR